MDFVLSEEEVALARSVRAICARRFPVEKLLAESGARFDAPAPCAGVDLDGWGALADAGVFALEVPESSGGVGLGLGPSAVVYEELGRAIVPGPLVSTHLAARDLPDVAEGAESGKFLVGSIRRPPSSERRPLLGVLVPHLSALDALVVVDDDRLSLVEKSALRGVRAIEHPIDPLTPLSTVEELPRGVTVADASVASRWRRDERVLIAALLVGIAGRCVEMAVEYAMEREQFGRPIGSFQAVKHMCADMLVRAETARVAVQAAAVNVDQPEVGDSDRAAAAAAVVASEAALGNARACIQVHGGMGFTWEVPLHLYLMRARVLAQALGSVGELEELVAERY